MSSRRSGQPVGLLKVVGLALVLGSLLLMVLFTAATLREIRLIEAAFGGAVTGAGRAELVPQIFIVNALGLAGVAVGALLLRTSRRRQPAGQVQVQTPAQGGVRVRPIRAEEHPAASDIVLKAYEALMGDELRDSYARVLADVPDRAAKAEVLVAVDDADQLLGCVTYVPGPGHYAEFSDDDAAGIRMLAVSPSAQGRGVGTALVRACLERAAADGRARVVLHSTPHMAAAQRLYEREGFRRAPERDWEPEPGVELLGFEQPVPGVGSESTDG
jgi:ribosomal protein S18 acetylase RimI-like enzyme